MSRESLAYTKRPTSRHRSLPETKRPTGVNPGRSFEQRTLGPSTHPVRKGVPPAALSRHQNTQEPFRAGHHPTCSRTLRTPLAYTPCAEGGVRDNLPASSCHIIPIIPLFHLGIVEIDTHAHLPFNPVHGRFQFMGSSLTGPMRGIGRSWRVDGRLRGCTGKRPRN